MVEHATGIELLENSIGSRGTAFSVEERASAGLETRPAAAVEALDTHAQRVAGQPSARSSDPGPYIHIRNFRNQNGMLHGPALMRDPAPFVPVA